MYKTRLLRKCVWYFLTIEIKLYLCRDYRYISCTFEWSHLPSKLKKFEYDCMLQNFDSYKNTDLNLDTVLEMMAVEKE